jgi:hypothetical protein
MLLPGIEPWTATLWSVNFRGQQHHAGQPSYDTSFLTKDVTGSDLSEGQQQDCEDVIEAGLDNEVECDASDS